MEWEEYERKCEAICKENDTYLELFKEDLKKWFS